MFQDKLTALDQNTEWSVRAFSLSLLVSNLTHGTELNVVDLEMGTLRPGGESLLTLYFEVLLEVI